jgi:hypothetical protein
MHKLERQRMNKNNLFEVSKLDEKRQRGNKESPHAFKMGTRSRKKQKMERREETHIAVTLKYDETDDNEGEGYRTGTFCTVQHRKKAQ